MKKIAFFLCMLLWVNVSLINGQVVISQNGASTPDSSAMLEIESNNRGFLPPRMNHAERGAIQNPAEGLVVYCTDCSPQGTPAISVFMMGGWKNLTVCNPPVNPVGIAPDCASGSILWKWHSVPSSTGYFWSAQPDTLLIEMTDTTYIETGLQCETLYTRYVWAVNSCGTSVSPVTLTGTTAGCWICGDSLTIFHTQDSVAPVTKTVTYGTTMNIPGEPSKCWITNNLGSDHQASSVSDATESSAGWYWQFNRKQGYKHDGASRNPNTNWIVEINEFSNWVTNQDPCAIENGLGWRVPTATEWINVDAGGSWSNWNGPWNSALKIHAAGKLDYSTGNLSERGSKGYYWTDSQISLITWAQSLNFSVSSCTIQQFQKAYGFPLRCIHD